jgi:hypothetical protein
MGYASIYRQRCEVKPKLNFLLSLKLEVCAWNLIRFGLKPTESKIVDQIFQEVIIGLVL